MINLGPEKFTNYNKKLRLFCLEIGKLSGLEDMFSKADDESDKASDLAEIKERGYTYPFEKEKASSSESIRGLSAVDKSTKTSNSYLQRASLVPLAKTRTQSAELLHPRNNNSTEILCHDSTASLPRSTSQLFYDTDASGINEEKDLPRLSRKKDIQKKSLPRVPVNDQEAVQ
jgi:hypothetical protein